MFAETWEMAKAAVLSFIDDEALSRGAAIAFYTVTSIAPVLLIVVAIAGLVFGADAAQNSINYELGGLMGSQTAEVLQAAVAGAAKRTARSTNDTTKFSIGRISFPLGKTESR